MDYGKILNRAWSVVWSHRYLILLGILAALGGGGSASSGAGSQPTGEELDGSVNMGPDMWQFDAWSGLAVGAVVAILVLVLIIALFVWVISTVARGGLIAGVQQIETAAPTSFGLAWRAAWERIWRLLGISLIPLIPVLILLFVGLLTGGMFYGVRTVLLQGELPTQAADGGFVFMLIATFCIMLPIILVLALLSTFAYRACILEETGVWASYSRGWQVLRENLGAALIIFVLQIVISIALGIALFIPNILMSFCFLFWPILLLIQGAITAYFSTVWTLAWREWTSPQTLVTTG